MPGKEDLYTDVDEKAGKGTNFEAILYLQMDRINKLYTLRAAEFITAVETLKSNLVFFTDKDKRFQEEIRLLEMAAEQELERNRRPDGQVTSDAYDRIQWDRSRRIFEALGRAMGRASLYGERKANFREK